MLSIIHTISLMGLDGKLVEVQTDITGGLPGFEIVGLPDITVKESKERIKSAIKNTKIELRSRKILINLAPSDIKKEGSGYDLPIAVGILLAIGAIKKFNTKSTIFIGELALDGKINKVPGILPICIEAKKNNIKTIYVPKENEKEAAIIKELEIIPVSTLEEVIKYINGNKEPPKTKIKIEFQKEDYQKYDIDFSDVKGQENAKRALEIAAAGWHNCLLTGSPGRRKNNVSKKTTNNFTRSNI